MEEHDVVTKNPKEYRGQKKKIPLLISMRRAVSVHPHSIHALGSETAQKEIKAHYFLLETFDGLAPQGSRAIRFWECSDEQQLGSFPATRSRPWG